MPCLCLLHPGMSAMTSPLRKCGLTLLEQELVFLWQFCLNFDLKQICMSHLNNRSTTANRVPGWVSTPLCPSVRPSQEGHDVAWPGYQSCPSPQVAAFSPARPRAHSRGLRDCSFILKNASVKSTVMLVLLCLCLLHPRMSAMTFSLWKCGLPFLEQEPLPPRKS